LRYYLKRKRWESLSPNLSKASRTSANYPVKGTAMPDVDSEAHEAQGDFYTVEEAAKVLGRTPGRICQLLRDGTLKGEGGGDP
jgi:hypothetical protein